MTNAAQSEATSEYPEHDKMTAVRAELDVVGAFWDWLQENDYFIATWDNEGVRAHAIPEYDIKKLLARWKNIDQDKIESEKRAMLDALRAMNH